MTATLLFFGRRGGSNAAGFADNTVRDRRHRGRPELTVATCANQLRLGLRWSQAGHAGARRPVVVVKSYTRVVTLMTLVQGSPGQIRPAKPFRPARGDILPILKK